MICEDYPCTVQNMPAIFHVIICCALGVLFELAIVLFLKGYDIVDSIRRKGLDYERK